MANLLHGYRDSHVHIPPAGLLTHAKCVVFELMQQILVATLNLNIFPELVKIASLSFHNSELGNTKIFIHLIFWAFVVKTINYL